MEALMTTTTSKWHPLWWKAEVHGTAWELVKEAMRRDWQQTKHDVGVGGHELNQAAADTVLQAGGAQRVPPIDVPNPPKVVGEWPELEPSFDFGYAARREYGPAFPEWSPELESKLRNEWIAAQDQAARDWMAIVAHVRSGYEYDTVPTTKPSATSMWPRMEPPTPG
jgi:hypothetical protein